MAKAMSYIAICFMSQAFEDACGAHAAADAHGDHAVACVATLQFADERGGELGAGAAEGMSESDGSAVGVYPPRIQVGLLNYREGLSGESFVQFDGGQIIQG